MNKTIEVQSPNIIGEEKDYLNVFLAGSIGVDVPAEQWQKKLLSHFKNEEIRFLNPRRDDWNTTWKQTADDDNLCEQVIWELTHLELADLIVMVFDPNTASPITLLELGLHARSGKLVVLCPEGFYRKGNVDITCGFYSIPQVDTFEELIQYIKNKI